MKILLKDLPTEKELKIYYQNMFSINHPEQKMTVLKVHKLKNFITMTIEYFDEISFITAFYQKIDHISTKHKYFSLVIDKEHFEHVQTNFRINNQYFLDTINK